TASRPGANGALPAILVSREDLAAAEPLPVRSNFASDDSSGQNAGKGVKRWNRTAVAAFVIALVGIPLFGLITGLIAMVIGCIALAGHPSGRRGLALGVAAVVIGLFEVVGWAYGLYCVLGTSHSMVSLSELTIDPQSLDALPDRIARAMRANVLIEIDG